MPDHDGYPTEDELTRIREWPFAEGAHQWFAYIRTRWHFRDWGWEQRGDLYYISTGGWSGNESLIAAMQDNRVLWAMTWWSSRRGGHYEFRVGDVDREDIKRAVWEIRWPMRMTEVRDA